MSRVTWRAEGRIQKQGSGRGVNAPQFIDRTADMRRWVADAEWMFTRAFLCLKDALDRANTKPPVPMPGSVKTILDSLLGANATSRDYQTVLGMYNELAQLREAQQGGSTFDILFRFDTGAIATGRTGDLNEVFPVNLERIGGQFTKPGEGVVNPSDPARFSSDDTAFLRKAGVKVRVDPYARCIFNDAEDLAWQKRQTGSGKNWCDILMGDVFQDAAVVGTISDWRKKSGAKDWSRAEILNKSLIQYGEIATVTVMHELIHSMALKNPIGGHAQVNGRSANGLENVLTLASTSGSPATVGNPDTLVFLAIFLSMPWYKWWAAGSPDGIARANFYTDETGKEKTWEPPSWLPKGETDQKKLNDEVAAGGPYCFDGN